MSKTTIYIACRLWAGATANVLFAKMPYILDEFNFVESTSPDFYIFANVREADLYNNCVKIYFPGENKDIDMRVCHWAFGERYEEEVNNPHYMRLPNYARLGAGTDLIKQKYQPQKILNSKTKFCAFVYKNSGVEFRNEFFRALSKYKRVDSPGEALNNMPSIDPPGTRAEFYTSYNTKINFLKAYKFTIAFANACLPGNTSEKIYHAMLANSIPIYWGNPLVHRDFNSKSFINVHEYPSPKDALKRVIEVDRDDNLYLKYLSEPWYHHNIPTQYTDPNVLLARFRTIFSGSK
jgi:hypothetical protein